MSKALGIHAGEAVGPALERFGHDILAEAQAAMQSERGTKVVIHDFRKAMKRWRAFLRLLDREVVAAARELRMQARDLARELAPARDVQAALDAFADLRHCDSALPPRSVSAMSTRIESRRQAENGAVSADIRDHIAAYLARADAALSAFPTGNMDVRDLAAALARSYGRARKLVPRDWAAASAEELHELRQRVVIHRYQIEIVQPLWPRYIRVTAGEAQRLRERLGHYQDLVVLEALTAPRGELARWRSRLVPLISERKQAHATAAAHNAGRLFAERPRALQRKLVELWSNPA